MPELPEVETIARELRARILERTITRAILIRDDLWKYPAWKLEEFALFFTGRVVREINRRGKYLLFLLDNDATFVAHLGMTGKFVLGINNDPEPVHLGCRFDFKDGSRLDYLDVRRFGRFELYQPQETISRVNDLGMDPLSPAFGPETLTPLISTKQGKPRRRAVHTALLDQRIISGIGNIYASEALFRAGINPQRSAGTLNHVERRRLASSLHQLMLDALTHGGTTVSDYRRVDDKPGDFRRFLQVYDRVGKPCRVCGTEIRRIRLNGRSAYYCPACQKARRL